MKKLFFCDVTDEEFAMASDYFFNTLKEGLKQKTTLLLVHTKSNTPKQIIKCINKLCPEASGLCYFDGILKSKDERYEFNYDPIHKVIEVNKLI
jgi:hypothetical protein